MAVELLSAPTRITQAFPGREQGFDQSYFIPVDKEHPFPENKGQFAQKLLIETGMPLTHVTSLAYVPNTYINHDVLGSAETGGEHDGRLTFYKDLGKIPAIGQVGVAVHELAHFASPLAERTTDDFGSKEKRLRALHNVIDIANQAAYTGVFLNGYHEYIYHLRNVIKENLQLSEQETNELWGKLWLEETHAIASELAATNYNQLAQVEEKQYRLLHAIGRKREFAPLVSRKDLKSGQTEISGIDQTLMDLTGIQDITALHKHWRDLRMKYYDKIPPFHENDPIQLLPPIPGRGIIIVYRTHFKTLRRSA